jgi:quinol monooxygenase YgiN
MIRKALLVTVEAKPGKEKEVESFLQSALPMVRQESGTISWYALKLNASTFGIFDTFSDEEGKKAHLAGQVAVALMARAPELFKQRPTIEQVDILAYKIPQTSTVGR